MQKTIVYTYKKPTQKILVRPVNQKEWIIRSIESSRKSGYTNLELYTNDTEFSKNLDIDKVHFIDDEYYIWDSFKIWVLENRKDDNYFLCDSDVIFTDVIKFSDGIDIHHDAFEDLAWEWAYGETIRYLENHNVFKDIDFWTHEKKNVINVGILKINNPKLKSDYIKYWKQLYQIYDKHIDEHGKDGFTQVLTQYLLTLLVENGGYVTESFSGLDWSKHNPYYKHYAGYKKLKKLYLI
jgi:hypothetical protein